MNPETIELIREAVVQAAGLFKEVSPQMWEMARMKVLAGAIVPNIVIFILLIISSTVAFINRECEDAFEEGKFAIPFLIAILLAISFIVFLGCGIYDYITIDYQTLRAVRQLIIGQ